MLKTMFSFPSPKNSEYSSSPIAFLAKQFQYSKNELEKYFLFFSKYLPHICIYFVVKMKVEQFYL